MRVRTIKRMKKMRSRSRSRSNVVGGSEMTSAWTSGFDILMRV